MTSKREGLGFSLYNCLKIGDDFVVVSVSNLLYFALGWISLFMKLERKTTSQREYQSGEYVGGNVFHHRCFSPALPCYNQSRHQLFTLLAKVGVLFPWKNKKNRANRQIIGTITVVVNDKCPASLATKAVDRVEFLWMLIKEKPLKSFSTLTLFQGHKWSKSWH